MSDTSHYDLLIIGAGIAGLSAAYAASRAGLHTAVIDRKKPGSGASGTPAALLNPATGRKAKKTWQAETCLEYTKQIINEAGRYAQRPYYSENGVIRPALDETLAAGMLDSFRNSEWPPGWVEWISEKELKSRFPGLICKTGGLWIPVGGTVMMKDFIQALYLCLKNEGVDFFLNSEFSCTTGTPFRAVSRSLELTAHTAIYAMGKQMTVDPLWEILPLHRVKGQTLTVKLRQRLKFNSSISSLGYIAQTAVDPETIVLGSTYEHHFDHLNADDEGAGYLLERLNRTLPGIHNMITDRQGWAGVRVTVPDKKPVIGPHPEKSHLYAFCALGSKGLMLGPYLGKLLIESILNGTKIPSIFSIDRLL